MTAADRLGTDRPWSNDGPSPLQDPPNGGVRYTVPSHLSPPDMATATEDGTATGEAASTADAETADDWEGIRYVFYVTAGWLAATALAVVLLMTVVPGLV